MMKNGEVINVLTWLLYLPHPVHLMNSLVT